MFYKGGNNHERRTEDQSHSAHGRTSRAISGGTTDGDNDLSDL
jgi:hypothetical protein